MYRLHIRSQSESHRQGPEFALERVEGKAKD